jgi:L-glyceraldehyde 3-phosphate reductase
MFNRRVEDGLLDVLRKEGIGCIAFTPLAQGLLTDRYLNGVPEDSRVAKDWGFLKEERLTDETLGKVGALNEMARLRGQSLAQMAIAWVLRHEEVTTALIGASRVSQIEANVAALDNATFTKDELSEIDSILSGE